MVLYSIVGKGREGRRDPECFEHREGLRRRGVCGRLCRKISQKAGFASMIVVLLLPCGVMGLRVRGGSVDYRR